MNYRLRDDCAYKVFNFNDEVNPIQNAYAKYDAIKGMLLLYNVKNEMPYKLKSKGTKEFSEFYLTTGEGKRETVIHKISYCGTQAKNFTIDMPKYFASYLLFRHSELNVKGGPKSFDFSKTQKMTGTNYTIIQRNADSLDLILGENFNYKDLVLEARLNFRQKSKMIIKFNKECTQNKK